MTIWRKILRGVHPGQYSDRLIRERREDAKRCICPSHASNRGDCPVHDEKGRVEVSRERARAQEAEADS
jgi:hypothetical protein